MISRNSLENKKQRRLIRYLRDYTAAWNRVSYRIIDGKQYAYQRPYRDFLKEWRDGKIKIITKGGDFIMDENQTTDPNAQAPADQPAEPQAPVEPAAGEQPASETPASETPAQPEAPAEGGEAAPAEPSAPVEPAA